jgi:hypothetical protein
MCALIRATWSEVRGCGAKTGVSPVAVVRGRGTEAAGLAGIAPSCTATSIILRKTSKACLMVPRANPLLTKSARNRRASAGLTAPIGRVANSGATYVS